MEIEKLSKMIMKLFSLKGRVNYSKIDLMAWTEQLKQFEEQQIQAAFSQVIRDPGFFDITKILELIEQPQKGAALAAWDGLIKAARAGGQVVESEYNKLADDILYSLGGMGKLRTIENEFVLSQMKKDFIELYKEKLKFKEYEQKQIGGVHAVAIENK